jgi:beta-galactosidase
LRYDLRVKSIRPLAAALLLVSIAAAALAAEQPRQRIDMDFGWRFHLGDVPGFTENLINAGVNEGPARADYRDGAWQQVQLPHDWVVQLPFDPNADSGHGYKPIGPGYPQTSVGWYRRSFVLSSADKGKRLSLEFDGVYRKCEVFLNGYRLTHHEGGYNGFRCDISDVANYDGQNVLAVRVEASEFEGWFYEGAGIYRHVWLVKTSPLAIAPDGIFVYSRFKNDVPQGAAKIHLETQLLNRKDDAAKARIDWQIVSPTGKVVAKATRLAGVESWAGATVTGGTSVSNPVLWSPESPNLYRLVTTVTSRGKVLDREETRFGIRTIVFDAQRGLLLNGRRYFAKGVCIHQDAGGVGIGVPDGVNEYRLSKLKDMGCNAIRTAHNEPAPELIEACDRLGLLVMDETRNFGSDPQSLDNLDQQIRRDRNHPSVFLWSLANEEPRQNSNGDEAIAYTMQRQVHRLDPTRPCTAALYNWPLHKLYGIFAGLDVQGFNYYDQGEPDAFHRNHPTKPCFGSEEGLAQYTRGIYENTDTYLSAYDAQKPGGRHTAEESMKFYAARPWLAGVFFWTGFDYRGEPTPFGWPNISSTFGILDTCGFPKDAFYYFQSCWTTKPMLHLLPHWSWPEKVGKPIDVWAYSNCDQVELFLNGKSLGRKAMAPNSHLQWSVGYKPGILSANGYRKGKLVASDRVETTGAAAVLKLAPNLTSIRANGEDVSVVTVKVTDATGRVAPTAGNLVHFSLKGPGRIIGVGNGDPASHEPDVYVSQPTVTTVPVAHWRFKRLTGITKRPASVTDFGDEGWSPANVESATGPLRPDESAVYEARVTLTSDQLENANAVLRIGMIDDEGWIYINGVFAGQSHNWRDEPVIDARRLLHAGENSITVVVRNHDGLGGLNKGVRLEFEKDGVVPDWKRSAFNGLAQVIVQSARTPGKIELTASGDGLTEAHAVIQVRP